MRHWLEDRIIQPRLTGGLGGVDNGACGSVIIELRRGNHIHRRLVWIGGSTASNGVRGFGRSYHEASLKISDGKGYATAYPDLQGGRLTRARLETQRDIIDSEFGAGATDLIDIKRTLIIVEDANERN